MPIESWVVIGIYLGFGLLELVRSDLFSKREQSRDDGIIETISTVLLLTVTQPLILVTVGWLGASKVFMRETAWWRLLQVVLAITIWPILLGAGIHNALLPSDSAEA